MKTGAILGVGLLVAASVILFAASCGGDESASAPQGGGTTPVAAESEGAQLPSEPVPGEITGKELGTSPATFRQEDDTLVIELDDGALVYRGPIDDAGKFRCTLEGEASKGTIEVIEGTIRGNEIVGSITRRGEKPEKITGTFA